MKQESRIVSGIRFWIRAFSVAAGGLLISGIGHGVCGAETADVPTDHTALVRQLGAPSHHQRERAARELIKVGLPAKPALLQAARDVDLEIRLGAQRVLVAIVQADFDARIAAFLDPASPPPDHLLAGWDLFQKQVESGISARQLFAEMIRTEAELLDAVEDSPETLIARSAARIQALTSHLVQAVGNDQPVCEASLATLLFVGSQLNATSLSGDKARDLSVFNIRLFSLLNTQSMQRVVLQDHHSPLLRQLLVRWLERGFPESQHAYAMQLVLKYELGESGLEMARQVLRDPHAPPSSIPYAAIVIARFGGPDDVCHLPRHLQDQRVFHTWSNLQLKKEPIGIQVRDVVLAMLIRATGQNPESFGYDLLEPAPETLYCIWTFGFLEDTKRTAALTKWESWRKAHGAEFHLTETAENSHRP